MRVRLQAGRHFVAGKIHLSCQHSRGTSSSVTRIAYTFHRITIVVTAGIAEHTNLGANGILKQLFTRGYNAPYLIVGKSAQMFMLDPMGANFKTCLDKVTQILAKKGGVAVIGKAGNVERSLQPSSVQELRDP